jgi:hypothetical protein
MSFFSGLIPANFSSWSIEVNTVVGRTVATARRCGVTIMLVHDEEGWWTVTKIHKGQIIGQRKAKRLPKRASAHIDNHRPRRHHGHAAHRHIQARR